MDQFETRGPHEQELSKLEQNYSPALLKIRRNEAIYAVVLFCLFNYCNAIGIPVFVPMYCFERIFSDQNQVSDSSFSDDSQFSFTWISCAAFIVAERKHSSMGIPASCNKTNSRNWCCLVSAKQSVPKHITTPASCAMRIDSLPASKTSYTLLSISVLSQCSSSSFASASYVANVGTR